LLAHVFELPALVHRSGRGTPKEGRVAPGGQDVAFVGFLPKTFCICLSLVRLLAFRASPLRATKESSCSSLSWPWLNPDKDADGQAKPSPVSKWAKQDSNLRPPACKAIQR